MPHIIRYGDLDFPRASVCPCSSHGCGDSDLDPRIFASQAISSIVKTALQNSNFYDLAEITAAGLISFVEHFYLKYVPIPNKSIQYGYGVEPEKDHGIDRPNTICSGISFICITGKHRVHRPPDRPSTEDFGRKRAYDQHPNRRC